MKPSPPNLARFIAFSCLVILGIAVFAPPPLYSESGDTASAYYQEGKKLQEQGQLEQAIALYEKAVQKNSRYEDAYFAMGVSFYKIGRIDSAITAFERVLGINPDSRETHNNLAVLYELQGDYDRAANELKETIRLDPNYQRGHLNLAKLYFARSIQEYFTVIQSKDPSTKAVRQKLRRLLQSDPDSADLQFNLGILNRIEGNTEGAEKALRNAARLDPAYGSRVTLELASLFEEAGRPNEAIDEYGRLLKANPNNFDAAYAAGRLKSELKDYAGAETYLRQARGIRSLPEVDFELGQALYKQGKIDESIQFYQDSLKQADNPEVHWSLAAAYRDQKEYTKALKEFESILDTYPDKERVQNEILEITRVRLAAAAPPPPAKKAPKSMTERNDNKLLPAPLVGLERPDDYALVVDKATQTMSLYQNQNGQTTHIQTFACSTGENNGKKKRAGDKKTPEGIYLFTSIKTEQELPAEYGALAFPMDYPNFYDRKQGKDGNGIWLHSTNEPLRALLPQKTRGCVVVDDKDIQELQEKITLYTTPIVIYDNVPLASPTEQSRLRLEILELLSGWEKSWEDKNINQFITFYASSFTNGKLDRAGWKKYKRSVFKRAKNITVEIVPHNILRHEDYLVVTLQQTYQADRYSDQGVKRIFLVQEDDTWRIVGEEWRKL